MWTIAKQLWTDPTYFRYMLKALISFVGGLLASGLIPTGEWRWGYLLIALAQGIPGGQRNTPPTPPPAP
jgi:hypothetical protein